MGLQGQWTAFRDPSGGEDAASLDTYFTSLALRHFIGDGWSADAQLPIGKIIYLPAEPATGVRPKTQRISGLGDLQLGLRYDFSALWGAGGYRPSVTLGLGVGLPTGAQEALGQAAMGALEPVSPTQLATGLATYSTRAQLSVTQFVARGIGLQAWIAANAAIGRTARGLHPGNRLEAGLAGIWRAGDNFALSGGVSGGKVGRADNEITGTISNSGATIVRGTVDATWIASEKLALTVGGRKPLYIDVNGEQVQERFSVSLGCIVTLSAEDDEHDDEHAAEGPASGPSSGPASGPSSAPAPTTKTATTPADVQVLAVGGASFSASKVATEGRLTVVDFWADWCAPCKVLGKSLAEWAGRDDRLAIRMVEVPDFDSDVAKAHLPGIDALPSAWFVMPNGQKQVLGGQSVEAILEAVQAALLTLKSAH